MTLARVLPEDLKSANIHLLTSPLTEAIRTRTGTPK
jgi:hypothetical protein